LLASAWIRLASAAKPFTANETGRDACLDDTFEHAAKNIRKRSLRARQNKVHRISLGEEQYITGIGE
jgi:hypothetical protein